MLKKTAFTLSLALLCLCAAGVSTAAEKACINTLGMEFVLMPAGSFMMGTDPDALLVDSDEMPRHAVTISKPFCLGKYEVTQAEWEAVMGSNPSRFKAPDNPVENVSWNDAQEFIRRLNQKEGHERYRLPTEAEWEYTARAGTSGAWFFGDDKNELSDYAWYGGNLGAGSTHSVGEKRPNPWGLHDVYGNVGEWVQDWYGDVEESMQHWHDDVRESMQGRHDETYYANSPETDPKGPAEGSLRVFRGGSWDYNAERCRSACRINNLPDYRHDHIGFRLVLSVEE